jgi:hypothetical protein
LAVAGSHALPMALMLCLDWCDDDDDDGDGDYCFASRKHCTNNSA